MTNASVPLSVLDLVPIGSGQTASQALGASVALARHAERLGYRRHWVAEHHNMPGIGSSAPAVLIAQLAAATSTIRVGSGGVMLPNHPPLVVAEQFGALAAMHPGRIDLGLGRAPGTDGVTARALRRQASPAAEDFPDQLGELIGFLTGGFDDDHPYRRIRAVPRADPPVPIWLLGSSTFSAQLAGMLGLPFCFAHHFASAGTLAGLAAYRSTFRPSTILSEPHAMIAAAVICADDTAQARYLAGPGALSMLRLRQGAPGVLPTPQEAADYPYSELDRATIDQAQASHIVGDPDTVATGITELLARTGADELMITTMLHAPEDRLHSYELVAKSLGRI